MGNNRIGTTDSTEPRAEGLLHCHNPECGSDDVSFLLIGTLEDGDGYIGCSACGMSGPAADDEAEASRLWNLIVIPRPTTDTVERAAVLAAVEDNMVVGEDGLEMVDWSLARTAIRALPSAAGGEDKLREALEGLVACTAGIGGDEDGPLQLAWRKAAAALQQEPTK